MQDRAADGKLLGVQQLQKDVRYVCQPSGVSELRGAISGDEVFRLRSSAALESVDCAGCAAGGLKAVTSGE